MAESILAAQAKCVAREHFMLDTMVCGSVTLEARMPD
jgi:hypothetical protein